MNNRLMLVAWTACFLGCGSPCETSPALRLHVTTELSPDELDIEIESSGDRFVRRFPVAEALADGETSLEIDVDIDRLTPTERLAVRVTAYADNAVVAMAETTTALAADQCVELDFELAAGGGCGNDRLDPGEECDGPATSVTCPSLGQRLGGGEVTCNMNCEVEMACLGGNIDSIAQIQGAIEDLRGAPSGQLLLIHPGSYTVGQPITLDVDGLSVKPLMDLVSFSGRSVFEVPAADVSLEGLSFSDVTTAVNATGPRFQFIDNDLQSTAADVFVRISGESSQVIGNHFQGSGNGAIETEGADQVVALNLIRGNFSFGLTINNGSGFQKIDHNSVLIDGAGTAFVLTAQNPPTDFCVRNNLTEVAAGATVWNVGSKVRLAACDGAESGRNGNFGTGTECTGRCNACQNSGALCDITGDAALDGQACPGVGGAARDGGADLGYDLLPLAAGDFANAGPDLGALEGGGVRIVGGRRLSCP